MLVEPLGSPQRMSFLLEGVSALADDVRFASLMGQYEPRDGVAFLAFTFSATAPMVNLKGVTITVPTHRNSIGSAVHTLMDYDHQIEDLPPGEGKPNNVVGHICALYMDEDDMDGAGWLVEGVIPARPLVTRGVMALYDRLSTVGGIVKEIRAKSERWYFSVEVGVNVPPPAIWTFSDSNDDHEITPWGDAPKELCEAAIDPKETRWQGKHVAYLMGGERGNIPYIGGAITQRPAGKEQRLEGHELLYICNWAQPNSKDFGEGVAYATYESMDGVPESLLNVDGVPLDLSQVNVIVKQAETAEQENKASNGWAVAKAGFKSDHTVRDGRWIRKEAGEAAGTDDVPDSKAAKVDAGNADKTDGNTNTEGGKAMAMIEIEETVLEEKLQTAGEDRLTKAITDGEVIRKDDVGALVSTEVIKADRNRAIAALDIDPDTAKEYQLLATNADLYPLDEGGQLLFGKATQRWAATAEKAKAHKEEKKEDKKEEKKEGKAEKEKAEEAKRMASLDEEKEKKDFTPGGGGGGGGASKGIARWGAAA